MSKEEKKDTLGKKLLFKTKSVWEDESLRETIMKFSPGYKKFLNECKTERESIGWAVKELKKAGYKEGVKGDKVFMVNRGKGILATRMGKKPLSEGFNIIVAHVDCPRLDLKPVPLYEDTGHAMFDTHYYGGIKKYQWANVPLAIHGSVILANGKKIDIVWGEKDDEGALVVTDILVHLSQKQLEAPAKSALTGEQMNALAGTIPLAGEEYEKESDKVKLHVLKILNEKFGLTEADLVSAELELVPAENCKEIGIDCSMIMGYGHDDRICSYTALKALLDMQEQPERAAIVWLVDKEEIGSEGTTGCINNFLEYFLNLASPGVSDAVIMNKSFCLSGDVNAAFDVGFKENFETKNAAFLGKGITITKYTGHGGKGGASDASAEFTGAIRKLLNDNKVPFQTGELGAVDVGGGGTVAKYMASRGIETIDAGPPVIGMHSPKETISKADLYSTYMGYKAFLENFAGEYIEITRNTH